MEHIGIDVHKGESQICIFTQEGEILERRVATRRERLGAVVGRRPRARILIEASTESEWVARCLEEWGHEVVVGDPNYAPMYAQRSRRVKTDRRDARALMEACRLGAYRPAHRVSEGQRRVRVQLAVRDSLVQTRTRYIGLVGALLRHEGLRVRPGSAEGFVQRVRELTLPGWLKERIDPLTTLLEAVNPQIAASNRALEQIVAGDPVVQRLCTVPGVGPVTAVAFVAALDQAERFVSAREVASYLGLVPREASSGERQHRGRITKAGNARARWLLVEAAWGTMRTRAPAAAELKAWAARVIGRRGRGIGIVALARKLARILYALWRDESVFEWRAPRERLQAASA